MKFVLEKVDGEEEVAIRYRQCSPRIKKLIRHMRQFCFQLDVYQEKKMYQIPLEDIQHIEVHEKDVIVYTNNDSFVYKGSLTELEAILKHTSLCRVSKRDIVNCAYISYVEPYANHRMLLVLENEERLIVNRHYLLTLKETIKGGHI